MKMEKETVIEEEKCRFQKVKSTSPSKEHPHSLLEVDGKIRSNRFT